VSTATDPAPTLNDRIFGNLKFDLKRLGDFIIRRRDGLFAYQLAVVVDDMDQGITHIVRGSDLLESTPWQLALFDALGGRRPDYAHLPLLTHAGDNSKLSKQTGALAIDNSQPQTNLIAALKQLGQPVAPYSLTMPLGELLGLAIENWRIQRVKKENIPIKTNS
jgi:glutamyl-Q tRNA(Asp) synthetase